MKKFTFTISHDEFTLYLSQVRVTKEYIKDEPQKTEKYFETNITIPIFRNTLEELTLGKKKVISSINYNAKYEWIFLNEIDS